MHNVNSGKPPSLAVSPNLISRYVLWKPALTLEVEIPDAPGLPEDLEAVAPDSLELATRIAVRFFLARTDAGAEVTVVHEAGPLWMAVADRTPLEELGLSARSFNCLKAASIPTLENLLAWTPARLTRLRHFGSGCLAEVTETLSALGIVTNGEHHPLSKAFLPNKPVKEGSPFACLLGLEEVLPDGALPAKLRRRGWQTLGDVAGQTLLETSEAAGLTRAERKTLETVLANLSLPLPMEQAAWVTAHRDDLRRRFHHELSMLGAAVKADVSLPVSVAGVLYASPASLNEELDRLIPATYDRRNRAVLSALFGLDGSEPLTLEEISKRQPHPTSRERIRQIGLPFLRALQAEGPRLLWLRKAMNLLREAAPCSLQQADTHLRKAGMLSSPLSVIAVLKLLDRAGLNHGLLVQDGQLLPSQLIELAQIVERKAYRDCARWGVADWKELASELADSRATARRLLREAQWLDDTQRYFTFAGRKNSLANRLIRMLHVAPRVCLAAAYDALFRDPRVDPQRLPRELFPAFCSVWPWCRVEGNRLVAHGKLPPIYFSGDDPLVGIMRHLGRPATEEELRKHALLQGMSEATLNRLLKHSNVLAAVNGRYTLIGNGCCDCC